MRSLPIEKILAAQSAVQASVSRASIADRRRVGFNPVIDGTFFPGGPFAPAAPSAVGRRAADDRLQQGRAIPVLGHLPWVTGATFDNLPEAMKPYLGDRSAEIVAEVSRCAAGAAADQLGLIIVGDLGVRMMSLQMTERKLAQKAADVFVYLFTWETPALGGRLRSATRSKSRSCFNPVDTAALTGDDPARLPLGETMARAWIAFARSGNPGWPAYDLTDRADDDVRCEEPC